MAGFFDMLQNGDVGGLLGTIGQGLADRRGLLYGIAANGFAGANEGRQSDQNALLLKQKQQERELKRQALLAYAQANGIDPGLAQDEHTLQMQIDAKRHEELMKRQASQDALSNSHWERNYKLQEAAANRREAPEYRPYSVKAQDGSESAGFYNPRDPNQRVTLPTPPPAAPGSASFAPTTEMKNKFVEKQLVAKDLNDALNNYEALVREHGLEPGLTEGRTALQAAHSDTILKMKEAAKLGVLNGPDLPLMEQQLRSMTPNGVIETINPATWYNATGRTQAGIAEIRKSVRRGLDNARQAYSGRPVDLSSEPAASQTGEAGTRPVPYSREEIIAELRRRQAARGAGQ